MPIQTKRDVGRRDLHVVMRAILAAVALTGCLQSNQVTCDDNRVCPVDHKCTPTGCASPEQIAACMGLADGTECTTSFGPGTCSEGICVVTICGNDIRELGEVCDDGNNRPGDGCDAKCLSLEICGNSVVDYFVDEQCDDGNSRSGDGCSSRCFDEIAAWQQVVMPSTMPTPLGERRAYAMAYDAERDRVVLFGGIDAAFQVLADTWEFDGTSWGRRDLLVRPSPRAYTAMTYDAGRRRIVLHGGTTLASSPLSDTWVYDDKGWTRLATVGSPGERSDHAMAYDAARDRVVLFGGEGNGETWELDGATWTKSSATGPPDRLGHSLAYDPVRGRIVLFGGHALVVTPPLQDTWEYDGVAWTQINSAAPPARNNASFAYDPVRQRLTLFGGENTTTTPQPTLFSDTWTYNGAWSQVTTAGTPPNARSEVAMVAAPRRGRIFLYGGKASSGANETWELGTSWVRRTVPSGEVPRSSEETAMAYDSTRGRTVLFIGTTRETWEYEDGMWTERAPSTSPSARNHHVMTYDPVRSRVVLIGGLNGSTPIDDQWEYDGSTWIETTPQSRPPFRRGQTVGYDLARGRIVMFGGVGASTGPRRDDTWEYDGAQWTQAVTPTSPSPRYNAAMAYDIARGRMVLLGGDAVSGFTNDTWEYDGVTWTQQMPSSRPDPRSNHAMAYDVGRGRIVLFGGLGGDFLGDTWEYDGTTWTEHVQLGATPQGRTTHAIAYDIARRQVVLYGGTTNDTWTFGIPAHPYDEACRLARDVDGDQQTGCSDDDCWGVCTPSCAPSTPDVCVMTPRCGDGACDPLETCRNCAADCATNTPACPIVCGDFVCDSAETPSNCPGDCL